DERNTSYGYNYQFCGNARLLDPTNPESFKNWPIVASRVREVSRTVAIADSMGTAANYDRALRQEYDNNARVNQMIGNNGFDLDPPRVDPAGQMAGSGIRSGADPRHLNKTNVLWIDGHAGTETLNNLGYKLNADGSFAQDGNNSLWSGRGTDEP